MKAFSRSELRILRRRLIEKEGLSEKDAEKRIGDLLDYVVSQKKKSESKGVLRNKRGKVTRKKG